MPNVTEIGKKIVYLKYRFYLLFYSTNGFVLINLFFCAKVDLIVPKSNNFF